MSAMRNLLPKVFAALLAAGAAASPPTAPPAPAAAALPAEAFHRVADIEQALLSPSGRWLALRTGVGGRSALAVFDLQDWGKVTLAARYSDADVARFAWVGDERLVYSLLDRQSGAGDQPFGAGLFVVRRDGEERRMLIATHGGGGDRRVPLSHRHRLLHIPTDGSGELIVGEWQSTNLGEPTGVVPKRLNLADGLARSTLRNTPDHAFGWWFDAAGRPRALVTRHRGREALYHNPSGADDGEWKQLAAHDVLAAPFRLRFVDPDGTLFVTVAEGPQGTSVLKRFDVARGRPHDDAVVRTPGFDLRGGLVAESAGGRTLGVRVVTDAETTVWFDPALKALQEEADRLLPGRINRLDCRRCGERDMVVLAYSWSDRDPGRYLVYFAATRSWKTVGAVRKDIDPRLMGRLSFERVRSRDGLEIPVWLTEPAGPKPGTPRPAVVLVHGGPWVRGGEWAWSSQAQFLASRGYVVIEPEFRGSTGYGSAWFRAGIRQWGLAMQDDLADALRWAVDRGLADPGRICIAGGSYGGYATLMGLARHPELYRCGAAWVAVTDLQLMFQWQRFSDLTDESREYGYPALIGDPQADAGKLAATSPVNQAGRIKAPVLLAMGGLDRRVPLEHGLKMRDALHAAGNPPQWVVYDDEAHGWVKLETRVDFATRLERFLAQHLK